MSEVNLNGNLIVFDKLFLWGNKQFQFKDQNKRQRLSFGLKDENKEILILYCTVQYQNV